MLDGFVAGATIAPATDPGPGDTGSGDPGSSDTGLEDLFPAPTDDDPAAAATAVGAATAPVDPVPGAPADGQHAPSAGTQAPASSQASAGTQATTVMPATVAPPQGSTAQRLRDFSLDSRMRVWRRRILITVIAGGIFSVIFNWRIGITIAVLVAVADAVYRSRTIAALPAGIKITGAMRRTQRQLNRMERSGYRAMHSRPIPNSPEWIDHLVVGPTGIYAIDSEKWDRRLPIRTRNARQLWHGPESKKDRLEHARWEAEQASTLLSGNLGREIHVRPAMAVYGPKVPWDILTIRDVDVFSGNRLRKYLRKRRKAAASSLTGQEIEKFFLAAEVVLPPQPAQ